ncbi:glutathione S-transferase N-terminal domain-containing protein [Paracoccus sp. S3-43]|uniref:glutathione S-transferase family protein n=1 Tax=Paracoccus sp. S3-43 TaxID=3030011 RepID=UPI0023B0AE82|nr:glutathione S-transferase N-terminal domain-containing protein [Paracoccus sp. S3-43]WEF24142.1 glutathione S-transferase family protein [Paracoccus sp. S3-43]
MRLFYAPGTCALAPWIALRWAGAAFEAVKVDYASAEFKRVNPLAQVPALDLGGPRAMTQADAILGYIAETHPAARLGPDGDTMGRFEFAEAMSFLTGDFHPAFWPLFAPQRFTADHSQPSLDHVKKAAEARVDRVMAYLDDLIGAGGHLYRDRRTVADAYAFVMARWSAKVAKTWKDYPNVARLFEWMNEDADVKEVLRLSAA